MKRIWVPIAAIGVVVATIHIDAQQQGDWNGRAPWAARRQGERGNGEGQRREPFKLFDNVYYVGLQTVSSYLITTSDGLVLLDATYADTADVILDNVRKLGFNPADIKYLFISHGHGDHYAGSARIKEVTGARIGMSLEDWRFVAQQDYPYPLARDLVIRDGQIIRVGDTTFKFYVSPGHTPGSLSTEYLVYDRGQPYVALSPGGLGFNFGPAWTPKYIESMERLKRLGRWDALLPNHPHMGPRDLFDLAPEIPRERHPNLHPAAPGASAIDAWFDDVLTVARDKLAAERDR